MEALLKDNFFLFLLLIVPGFVAIKVFDLLVASERRDFSKSLIEVAAYGAVNLALLRPLVGYLDPNGSSVATYVVGVLIVLVVPAFLAVGWRALLSAKFLRGVVIHPVPAAWDFYFQRAEPCWVICHLKSGELVGGWFGEQSFASGFPQAQELYIERLWKMNPSGAFESEVDRSLGGFVRREDCNLVEFFRNQTEGRDQNVGQEGAVARGISTGEEGLPASSDGSIAGQPAKGGQRATGIVE